MIIGLAGKSCSGKNAVAEYLAGKGFETVDMDLMAHDVLNSLGARLSAEFGSSILDSDDAVDRRALGSIVFPDPEKLKKLEDILYPELHKKLESHIQSLPEGKTVVVNAAALEKGEFWKSCDRVLWVQAPFAVRLFRALKRDRRSLKNILQRFASQKQLKSQYFFSRVDTSIIRNGSTLRVMRRRVDKWIERLPSER
ncbi:MAG: dephospho-CoA kinase [Spirochaetales bacterium]|nr:dephospho-CoA kinase [Spirochaetales bacterium]